MTTQSTAATPGSATRWGPLWGARPADWAISEDQQVPIYEDALRQVGLEPGESVLDQPEAVAIEAHDLVEAIGRPRHAHLLDLKPGRPRLAMN